MGPTIHERFASWVARDPERVAVSSGGASLTYAALDRRAADLATHVVDVGATRGALVGVCLDRSPDLVAALLAVLKAGAAYLPLDPAYPSARLAAIAEDAAPCVILAARHHASLLPAGCRAIWIEDVAGAVPGVQVESAIAGADDLAYVIYTSGSTGRPKGVAVEHRNVLWLFDSTQPLFGYGACDVWSLTHSYAFDFSVWEIFGALLSGGRLALASPDVARQPDALWDFLARERVTMLSQTPSAFWPLADADDGRALVLRWIVFGGEALDVGRLRPWFTRRGDRQPRLVNMYGITETTVHVTYRALAAADVDGPLRSPIGAPLPGVTGRVVDAHGVEVPPGTPGDLWVGGAGVARGYLGRPDLTAERFVEQADGARYYRSGDVVVRHANDELEYRGRGDDQVKIRGFRIELGEIEATLRDHPAVRDAVVRTRPVNDDQQLVAWMVARGGAFDEAALREHVERHLPEYMRPVHYVTIDAIPLTPNGKVDGERLPMPRRGTPGAPVRGLASDTERRLAEIWCDVLAVDGVSSADDFFRLGGHSLNAATMLHLAAERFGIVVALPHLYAAPTLGALARHLDATAARPQPDRISPRRRPAAGPT